MANVIDTLFLELGIDMSRFSSDGKEAIGTLDRMTDSFEKTEKQSAKTGARLGEELAKTGKHLAVQEKQTGKNAKQAKNLSSAFGSVVKGLAAFGALVMGSNAFDKLAQQTSAANVQMDNLSKNIGMSRNALSSWGGMAAMFGGSAEGMTADLANLSMGITRLTTMGDTSMVPFFNAFGVSILNTNGHARDLDSIMLDLADRFSQMDRAQAYNLAKSMGMDDGTINTLMAGRTEMQKMLDLQKELYRSSEADIKASRELTQARAYLNQQWDSLKLMLGNALTPILLKVVKIASGFVNFLMRHEQSMKHIFEGLAIVIGLTLIPVLWSAVTALYTFLAPFALIITVVAALGAAFLLLYDDYKTWAEGGESLFDWGKFVDYFKTTKISTDSLSEALAYLLTGYKSWSEAGTSLFDWLRLKGFIDDNGVSVESLATGFVNLWHEVNDGIPVLKDLLEVFNHLMKGNFSEAWTAAVRASTRIPEFTANMMQKVLERGAGAVDVATGHDPNDPGSLAGTLSQLPQAGTWAAGKIRQYVGGEKNAPTGARETASAQAQGKVANGSQNKGTLNLSERDIDDIIKVASTEVVPGLKGSAFSKQTAGVVDTILNRASINGGNVRAVVNAKNQFSAISGNKDAYGSVQAMPNSRINSRVRDEVMKHLQARASGQASSVGGHVNYLNPTYSSQKSLREWGNDVVAQGKKSNMVFGSGNAMHYHGTAKGAKQASNFAVRLPGMNERTLGSAGVASGASKAKQSLQQGDAMRQAQNVTNNNQKNVHVAINGGINVQSSASTIDGTMADASAAMRDRIVQTSAGMA